MLGSALEDRSAVPETELKDLLPAPRKALLLTPPVYDIRFPWARWQQPALLLRLATFLTANGSLVELIDAIEPPNKGRLRRSVVDKLDLDGVGVRRWRFGAPSTEITGRLAALASDGFTPDIVYVECFTTFWWEGAAEIIGLARKRFPTARLCLIGAYPSLAPNHARAHSGADHVIETVPTQLSNLPPDLSVYQPRPLFSYVSLGDGSRSAEDIADEIMTGAANRRTLRFAFSEHGVVSRHPQLFRRVLELLATRRSQTTLYCLGSVTPAEIAAQTDLPALMRAAGFAQVNFADDRELPLGAAAEEELVEHYRKAAELFRAAGFAERSDVLSAGLCIGRPGEDLASRVRLASLLAHHVGSIIFWPYQPLPSDYPDIPLERLNGKLFPCRADGVYAYADYRDMLGLGAILNAKYREHSFDFLGEGLIPRLARDSLKRHGWDPDPAVKGTVHLPVSLRS